MTMKRWGQFFVVRSCLFYWDREGAISQQGEELCAGAVLNGVHKNFTATEALHGTDLTVPFSELSSPPSRCGIHPWRIHLHDWCRCSNPEKLMTYLPRTLLLGVWLSAMLIPAAAMAAEDNRGSYYASLSGPHLQLSESNISESDANFTEKFSMEQSVDTLASAENTLSQSEQGEKKGGWIVVAVEVVFGEGAIDVEGVRDAFRVMDEESQKEPGCIKYVSSVDINDSTIVRIDELWESMEALEAHFKTPHMAAFQRALSGIETKSMSAKVYEIKRELPFPKLRAINCCNNWSIPLKIWPICC